MTTYVFLSDEWLVEARRIVEAHPPAVVDGSTDLVVNVVVTGTPFGEDRTLHLGAAEGQALWGPGHRDDADVTLTTDYETARAIFVAGEQQVVMDALLAGRMKIQGDLAKLMAAQAAGVGPLAPGLGSALQAMTE